MPMPRPPTEQPSCTIQMPEEVVGGTNRAEAQRKPAGVAAAMAAMDEGKDPPILGCSWIPEDKYREYGYPEMDQRFKDKEWHRKQMELDRTDPRHNPNLNRDQSDPEFWYNAARKPFSKALLRSEQHWERRRELWAKQMARVQSMNAQRESLSDHLEGCSNDMKRLVGPILKYAVAMVVLGNMLERAREFKKEFRDVLEEDESRQLLGSIRQKIDAGGDHAAEELMREYDERWNLLAQSKAQELEDTTERTVADVGTLATMLNWAQKCKKDGILQWEQGNWAEAHASWRQGDETLKRIKAPDRDESSNKMLKELHVALLKNLSQASMKLGFWTDALAAAEAALTLQPDDHKAWFRRASALEGLGRLDDAEEALDKVDECAVGRADRERISIDTCEKREKLQALRQQNGNTGHKMLRRALERGVFGEAREELRAAPNVEPESATADIAQALPVADECRKKLTAEGAEDLLVELTHAFGDSGFQRQIFKLAHDVRMDRKTFLDHLTTLALPLQAPIIARFGFEPTPDGVREMKMAVAELIRTECGNGRVKARADETTIAMYGCMYDALTLPESRPGGESTAGTASR